MVIHAMKCTFFFFFYRGNVIIEGSKVYPGDSRKNLAPQKSGKTALRKHFPPLSGRSWRSEVVEVLVNEDLENPPLAVYVKDLGQDVVVAPSCLEIVSANVSMFSFTVACMPVSSNDSANVQGKNYLNLFEASMRFGLW